MPRPIFRLALAAALLAGAACTSREADHALETDSALARDIVLAGEGQPSAEPEFNDVPEASPEPERETTRPTPAPERPRPTPRPAPARERPTTPRPAPRETASAPTPAPAVETPAPSATAPEPAPEPAAPARRVGTVGAGTQMGFTLASRVCSDGNRVGDKMVAQLAESVTGTNGLVFPAGSKAVVEIASIVRSEQSEVAQLTFRVKYIDVAGVTHFVSGEVVPEGTLERVRTERSGGSDKKKVIGGAIAGAIIGQVLGGDAKGTVIGAAAGAAAGTAAARAKAVYESCLPAGAKLRLTLSQPIEVEL